MEKIIRALLIVSCMFVATFLGGNMKVSAEDKEIKIQAVSVSHIHMNTRYIDGVSIYKTVDQHILSLKDYLHEHPQWTLMKKNKTHIFLKRTVNDLSPVSKAAGVLGLKDGHTLTLFRGNPAQNRIIQTFFQIDVQALQASEYNLLKSGIPITNKRSYQKMLHMLTRYEMNG